MSAKGLVRTWMNALEEHDLAQAKELMAPNFVCEGVAPVPLDRDQFLAMHDALSRAFPDFSFNARNFDEPREGLVVPTISITGTHIGALQLPIPGAPRVPPTGRTVRLPNERPEYTVVNGKLAKIRLERVVGGGVLGILAQLGATLHVPEAQANMDAS